MKKGIFAIILIISTLTACSRTDVLVLTERGGQHGSFTDAGLAWLEETGRELEFTVTEINSTSPINKNFLKKFDLIIQLDFPPYTWTDKAAEAFISYIEDGKGGWIGFHHATLLGEFDGYPMWDWFSEFMGGIRYRNYNATLTDGDVYVEDVTHPIMQGVDSRFLLQDEEWYIYDKSPRGNVRVLASADESTYYPPSEIKMGDHPVVWINENVKARNVYFQFGHGEILFKDKNFVTMFRNAIKWTTGDVAAANIPDDGFRARLEKSGFLHEPLSVSEELSYENLRAQVKTVEAACPIEGNWELVLANDTGVRATGSPDDPDYATYGNFHIDIPVNMQDSEAGYNRISFQVYPDCEGMGVTNINLHIPGVSHLINLKNRQWNHCTLEADPAVLASLQSIRISSTARGKDLTYGDKAVYKIRDVALERISHPYKSHGWEPDSTLISYSTTGYQTGYEKTAVVSGDRKAEKFKLIDENGRTAYRGKAVRKETSIGNYRILDFTRFDKAGEYAIEYDGTKTPYFKIGDNIWENAKWKVLNYIFCQRCGYNVPGIHSTCHTDLYSKHNGVCIPYCGGWHDAGDLSQQTLQTADVTFSLFEAYNKHADIDPALAARLKEEARWGLEFILKNRYGDGYRASSMGLLHWTDGVVGSKDDIYTVRVQNLPFDNFLYSGYEAYAALTLKKEDPKTYDYLVKVAEEDFEFAMEKYLKDGYAGFVQPYEHTYNTSRSQFMATVSWAASQLFMLTGKNLYAEKAAKFMGYVMECQQTEPIGEDKVRGFFWRDTDRKSIVHYIHQSRDQFYMMALESLCRTQPDHTEFCKWKDTMKMYGEYLKSIFRHTYPYNMMPSGVYHIDEASDSEAFYALHLFPPHDAEQRYEAQIKRGVKLSDEFYVKRFPVWFNIFNGNNAVILSTAKAAAICANMFDDMELKQMALDQLYWISGKNPFNQSMIYGEGANYPSMDSFSSGDIVGAMPVGIKTIGDEDVPEWPQVNNACYKEVWVTTAGRWISLLNEL